MTKATLDDSNTRYAQGGIAAAIGPEDSPARHLEDTVRAGGGLVDRTAARILVEEAPRRIADLVRFGVPFDTVEGQIALGREAARLAHPDPARPAGTRPACRSRRRSSAAPSPPAWRPGSGPRCADCSSTAPVGSTPSWSAKESGEARSPKRGPWCSPPAAPAACIARARTPPSPPGEGVAVAARAGALIVDMEFMQFHPTVFFREGAPRFLLTEALRGEGALLRNELGERFLPRYHPDAELAPRDIVSRAIHSEMERTKTRCVYLDATAIPRDLLFARFPTVCRFLSGFALDPSRDLRAGHPGGAFHDRRGIDGPRGAQLAPRAPRLRGGSGDGRARGEPPGEQLALGGGRLRGARRPPAAAPRPGRAPAAPEGDRPRVAARRRPLAPGGVLLQLRETLWEEVGIVRTAAGLRRALKRFEQLLARLEPTRPEIPPPPEAHSVLTALLIARAALAREESRGAHFRSDFPRPRPEWRFHLGERVLPAARP